jgi:hypothetical protein
MVDHIDGMVDMGMQIALYDGASEFPARHQNAMFLASIDSKSSVKYAMLGILAPQSRAGVVITKVHGSRTAVILREDPRGYHLIGSMQFFSLFNYFVDDGDDWEQITIV